MNIRRFRALHEAGASYVEIAAECGDEGAVLAHVGVPRVHSFHMVLSHSRDPFCLFTTSMDMATFWAAHRAAFAHFGGVSASIVYDRTKTVVKRHVAPGFAVPIHPEAAAFAAHYGFAIDVLAAYRPTGKGRVERQVLIVRDHVLAGRTFDSLAAVQQAFTEWLPIRRAQVHRTHGHVIGVRAHADRAALAPVPTTPYLVCDRFLRRVGRDCLISFAASYYSVPARQVHAGQQIEVRVGADSDAGGAGTLNVHQLGDGTLLATHRRATVRGSWVVDPTHWDGLPDGWTRATVVEMPSRGNTAPTTLPCDDDPAPQAPLTGPARVVVVAIRPLSDYADAALADDRRVAR